MTASSITVIKFSHNYYKLKAFDLSKPFILLEVLNVYDHPRDIPLPFVEYDSTYQRIGKIHVLKDGHYPLPLKPLMVLLLEQDYKLLTTIRSYTPQKFTYYTKLVGQQVMCKITDV